MLKVTVLRNTSGKQKTFMISPFQGFSKNIRLFAMQKVHCEKLNSPAYVKVVQEVSYHQVRKKTATETDLINDLTGVNPLN